MSWKKPSWEAERRFAWRVGVGSEREMRGGEVVVASGDERRVGRERESVGGRR